LVGFGSIGQAVLLQIAYIGHFKDGAPPKVTLVDQNVHAQWLDFKNKFKLTDSITKWVNVDLKEINVNQIKEDDLHEWSSKINKPFTTIYACTKNEVVNLRVAKVCIESTTIPDNVAVVAIDPPGGFMLTKFKPTSSKLFDCFSLIERMNSKNQIEPFKGLMDALDDTFPKFLHTSFIKKYGGLEWDSCDESDRESNRRVADHFAIKLRALGSLRFDGDFDFEKICAQDLEMLMQMEHNRWWAAKDLNGWTYSPNPIKKLKQHKNMIEYDDLSRDDQIKDKDILKATFEYNKSQFGING